MAEEVSSARETLRARSARNQRRRGAPGINLTLQTHEVQHEPQVEGKYLTQHFHIN